MVAKRLGHSAVKRKPPGKPSGGKGKGTAASRRLRKFNREGTLRSPNNNYETTSETKARKSAGVSKDTERKANYGRFKTMSKQQSRSDAERTKYMKKKK